MKQFEDMIYKSIITSDGEKEFQIRYIRDENVGILTTRTDKSFFILDSADYWYDLIQEKYPPIMKCSCKNDYFNVTFQYTLRMGTSDFSEINITCQCTECQKIKKLSPVEIDYSPSNYLFDSPITFCKQPKIKYKTYSLMGYWSDEEVKNITQYLAQNSPYIYGWYWDSNDKRNIKKLSMDELGNFLYKENYLAIFFSQESLDDIIMQSISNEKGIFISRDIWRKNNIFKLNGPFLVVSQGLFYEMNYCSEYLDKEGNVIQKSPFFCELVKAFQKQSKLFLKK